MDNSLDHQYTSTTYGNLNAVENTYKMTPEQIEEMVKLRASNQYLFSGRRNAAKYAWRAILNHMGLQGTMTHCQVSKKWDNLKKKHKDLKYPPEGVKVSPPEQWPYFTLMDDATEGRLCGSAPLLMAQPPENGDEDFVPASRPKKRIIVRPSLQTMSGGAEIEVVINREEEEMDQEVEEVENERAMVDRERVALESDREVLERERQVLQRERAGVDREMAALERDRACLDREKAAIANDRVAMEREKGMMERDRATLARDRRLLQREKEGMERWKVDYEKDAPEKGLDGENGNLIDREAVERKGRFLHLFEKLIQSL